jgi:hypothetical protein
MKTLETRRSVTGPFDPRYLFGIAWIAAFLGLVLIIVVVLWAIVAFA